MNQLLQNKYFMKFKKPVYEWKRNMFVHENVSLDNFLWIRKDISQKQMNEY